MPSPTRPCDDCAHYLRCKRELLACSAFARWAYAGRTLDGASRDPSREAFLDLARFDDAFDRYRAQRERETAQRRAARLKALEQLARQEARERRRLVVAGIAEPLTKAERRRMYLKRRRLRWRIDPSLRERHLQLKREDAKRRARRRGAAPAGSAAAREHRRVAQRQRRQAEREREGRTMNGREFRALRQRLGLTIHECAIAAGASYGAAKQWQRRTAFPPVRLVRWLRAIEAGEKVPARSASIEGADGAGGRGYSRVMPLNG